MEQTRAGVLRRSAVLLLVLSGHVLLLSLISESRHSGRDKLPETVETMVLLLPAREPRAESRTVKRPEMPRTGGAARTTPITGPGRIGENTAIAWPDESPQAPRADWHLEARIAGEAMQLRITREDRRRCAEAEWTHAARLLGCEKRYYDKAWQPSGDFLKDMHDPERPRSSVPDALPDAFLKAPLPVVLQDQDPHR